MSMEKPIWWDYAVFDEDGLAGIREDTPQAERLAYEAHVKFLEENPEIKL